MLRILFIFLAIGNLILGCKSDKNGDVVTPFAVTEKVAFDTDDPAIWINRNDVSKSLIIGTDKGGDSGEGGLYVFGLDGKIDTAKSIKNLKRPNNVDVAYDLNIFGRRVDIAVFTERNTNRIRVFSMPDLKPIDGDGISVFEDEPLRAPMGIALYTNLSDTSIYAIVGRKSGPTSGYLYQYRLYADTTGVVRGQFMRKFGKFSGNKEIESIAVDNELGYIYCSDEGIGVRKYYAHPDSTDQELALFATTDVKEDHEGLSIYKANDGTGYILLSDQQANRFLVFPREGTADNRHNHPMIKAILTSTDESDGSEVSHVAFNAQFPNGLFVAMSTDKTFQIYRWEDLAGKELFLAPNGIKK